MRIVGDRGHDVSAVFDELLDFEPVDRATRLACLRNKDGNLAAAAEVVLGGQGAIDKRDFLGGSALEEADMLSLAGQAIGAYPLERPFGSRREAMAIY